MTPLVSVITTLYNQEDLVRQALQGILNQRTDFPIEVIVADDGSTDGSLAAVESLRDPRIVLLRREHNLGYPRNMLDAWRHCRGRYIAICDADDYWTHPDKLQRQVSLLEANPAYGGAFHRVVNLYVESGEKTLSNGTSMPRELTFDDLTRWNPVTNCSVLYRALPAEEIPTWIADATNIDYTLHLLHARRGPLVYDKRPMAAYRKFARGIWSSNRERALRMSLDGRCLLIRRLGPEPGFFRAATDIARALYTLTGNTADIDTLNALRAEYGRAPIDPAPAVAARRRSPLHTLASALSRRLSRMLPAPRPARL